MIPSAAACRGREVQVITATPQCGRTCSSGALSFVLGECWQVGTAVAVAAVVAQAVGPQ